MNFFNWFGFSVASVIGIIFVFAFGLGIEFVIFWIVQNLWNYVAPIFWANAPILTFWQAAACTILLQLFGGFFKSNKSTQS